MAPRRLPAHLLAPREWLVSLPPPPSRTKWTRFVPHPVLIGHAASQVSIGGVCYRKQRGVCASPLALLRAIND
jgi:hypothetical protein